MRPAAVLIVASLIAGLVLTVSPLPGTAAPIPCPVTEGVSVSVIRLGMPAAEALRLAGTPVGRVTGARAQETVYLFTTTLAQITVEAGLVSRIATRHPTCVTGQGVRIGDSEARVRLAYERAPGSLRGQAGAVTRYVYPFTGVEFVLTEGRVTLIEVFRAEPLPARATPTPAAAAPGGEGAVAFRSLTGRVEGTTFVVAGSVANAGVPLALFVEVALLGAEGRHLSEGTTPLVGNPIGAGRAGSFEVRLPVNEIVTRFVVTVRPMNRPTVTLAVSSQDVKEVGQFAYVVVERLLEVTVLGSTQERASGTFVAVTNRSHLKITGLVLEIEMQRTCTNRPIGSGLYPPVFRTFTDIRRGTIRVGDLGPNARVEVPIDLAGTGACLGEGPEWRATWKVLSAKVEEEKKS